jgi:uncharacterized protein YggE
MSASRRLLGIGVVLGLVAGSLAGAGAVLAQGPDASAGTVDPAVVRVAGDQTAPSMTVGSGSAAAGAAIAYPYPVFGGSPGIAPDHTIVVTGTGQANGVPDGSDRAVVQKRALVAALADAKAQATTIASTVGVSIKGVVSVSSSVGFFGPIPLVEGGTGATPNQPPAAPNLAQPIWPGGLSVSVTVVYAIG